MPPAPPWQILVIDDDTGVGPRVAEILDGAAIEDKDWSIEVLAETDFDRGLVTLEKLRFDLVILDVRLGATGTEPEAGVQTLAAIRARRFVPVIFYTNLPGTVRAQEEPPMVQVVEKSAGNDALIAPVRTVFQSGLPLVNRALIKHLEETQRDYMWDFVAKNWNEIGAHGDRVSLAYLLARRLAMSLSGPGVDLFAAAIGGDGATTPGDKSPAMKQYLLPALDVRRVADLVQGTAGDRHGLWVVLTPTCDLMHGKADRVLLAPVGLLGDQPEVLAWQRTPSRGTKDVVDRIVNNQRDRYHFLPAALTLPDLVVDFQGPGSVPRAEFDAMAPVASLDSPYAESLVARFLRFYIRVGAPDLDLAPSLARLASGEVAASPETAPGP
jgi:DNA-binding NarL/FixJ family response regulator